MRRSSSSRTRGRQLWIVRHGRSPATNHSRQRRGAAVNPGLELGGVLAAPDPGREPASPAVVDRVDHAEIGKARNDHSAHPLERLGERQRAVGDGADRVEQAQALGAPAGALARPGAGNREAGADDDHDEPEDLIAAGGVHVPGGARGGGGKRQQADAPGERGTGEQRGGEGRDHIAADDRRRLAVERDVDDHAGRQQAEAERDAEDALRGAPTPVARAALAGGFH